MSLFTDKLKQQSVLAKEVSIKVDRITNLVLRIQQIANTPEWFDSPCALEVKKAIKEYLDIVQKEARQHADTARTS